MISSYIVMVEPAWNPSKPNLFVWLLEVILGPYNDTYNNCYRYLAGFDFRSRKTNTILIGTMYTKQFNIYIIDFWYIWGDQNGRKMLDLLDISTVWSLCFSHTWEKQKYLIYSL